MLGFLAVRFNADMGIGIGTGRMEKPQVKVQRPLPKGFDEHQATQLGGETGKYGTR
jgi:hypothetical protein